MRKHLVSFLFAGALAYAQIGAPLIGFVRYPDGSVRALRGVAGNFSVGERITQNVDSIWFDGRHEAAVNMRRHGDQRPDPAASSQLSDPGVTWSEDEVTITATGVRIRVPFKVRSVERVGSEYLLISGSGSQKKLLRATPRHEALYELPEAAE